MSPVPILHFRGQFQQIWRRAGGGFRD